MELLGNLGINGKLFIAQLINFAILFFVLKKFAYQPILKVLDERKDKIEKGLKDAEKAGEKLEKITVKEEKVLRKANAKAQDILMTAEKKADENRVVAVEKTEEEIAQLMKKAEQKIAEKKEQMLQELKKDVAGLVVMATEKVLDEKIDNNKDGELIKKAVRRI
jgi:F-type H+-transporting ATPase subunit b